MDDCSKWDNHPTCRLSLCSLQVEAPGDLGGGLFKFGGRRSFQILNLKAMWKLEIFAAACSQT
jgi:hypothetical protein